MFRHHFKMRIMIALAFVLLTALACEACFRFAQGRHWIERKSYTPVRKEGWPAYDFSDPVDYPLAYAFPNCPKRPGYYPYWAGIPNCKSHVFYRGVNKKRLIAEADISFDSAARRIVPAADPNGRDFLLFLGCSFTFGEGVSDSETFPNLVTQELIASGARYNAFNLGMEGWGPNETLRLLESKPDPRLVGISGQSGTAIFTFINDQVLRALGTVGYFRRDRAFEGEPYYYLGPRGLVSGGSFRSGRPIRTFLDDLLSRSDLYAYLRGDIAPIGDEGIRTIAGIFARMRDVLSEKFGVKRFVVSIYPGERTYASRLVPLLRASGVEVWDFSGIDLHDQLHGRDVFQYNDHPTPDAYRAYADLILKKLRTRSIRGDPR